MAAVTWRDLPKVQALLLVRSEYPGLMYGPEMPEWKRCVLEQMEKRISFHFVGTPLADVIAFLSNLTGTGMVLDPVAVQGDDVPVTLKVRDMRLGTAMDWALELSGLSLALTHETIFISTPERLAALPVTYAYDLAGHVPASQYAELLELLHREVPEEVFDPRSCVKIFGDILLIHRMERHAGGLREVLAAMGIPPIAPRTPMPPVWSFRQHARPEF